MAVTGTNTFTVTRDDVIKAALRLLGVIGVGETPVTEDYTNCSQALNIMIKGWAKKGIPLWVTQDLSIPMITGVSSYNLGPTGGSLVTAGITITAAGTGGVDGTYALTITDAGGGTGATGTYTISGNVVTAVAITAVGTGYVTPVLSFPSGSISGATATAIVSGLTMSKPLKVFDAFIRDSDSNDTPLFLISRQEYDVLGNKTTSGTPNQFYYDNQFTNGVLYVYNVPSDLTHTIHAQIQRQFYDMTSSTDSFDFPQEWFQALKWGLAAELCVEYGVSGNMITYYEQKAGILLDESFDYSVEEASVYFSVDPQVASRNA